jgi:hypothetical protein
MAVIAHLPSLEATDGDPRQAEQRFLLRHLRQHRPQTCEFDPFRRPIARGGTLAGSWINMALLLDRRTPEIAVATRRASAMQRLRRLPDLAQLGKL